MSAVARSDPRRRSRGLTPDEPLERTRRAAAIGLGVLAAIAALVIAATRTPEAIVAFAPVLVPAVVATVVIAAATAKRQRRARAGEVLTEAPAWASRRGVVLAVLGASLVVVGSIVFDVGLLLELNSVTFWGESQTPAQEWQESWGFVVAGVGAIGVFVGAVLYPVAAIKTATARAARLQSR